MIWTALFTVSASAALASAAVLPVYPRTANLTNYDISNLETHFMGKNSGLPGGSWPTAYQFDSTINFSIDLSDSKTTCAGSWPYSSNTTRLNPVPDYIDCADEGKTQWRFDLFTSETRFRIDVLHYPSFDLAYTGATNVSSNDYQTTTNFLTCSGGAPTDGIRCKSNDKVISIAVQQMPLKRAKELSAKAKSRKISSTTTPTPVA
ncbi:uncharacterized protein J3D65DRAFT_667386 [Phyllosticta citribraziliensis]|uniref:AA1-like domain-containing protein n=1 Tax=Phyllosticta citribraziliensis TaxID=989973 RepID=A0ABR1LU95_9PEZI